MMSADLDESAKRYAWAALPAHVRWQLTAMAGGGPEKFTLAAICCVLAIVSGQLEEASRDRNSN